MDQSVTFCKRAYMKVRRPCFVALWFQEKTHVSLQVLDLGRYNFFSVAPKVMILTVLKSQCRELSKNVYFYPILTYSFDTIFKNVSRHPKFPLNLL